MRIILLLSLVYLCYADTKPEFDLTLCVFYCEHLRQDSCEQQCLNGSFPMPPTFTSTVPTDSGNDDDFRDCLRVCDGQGVGDVDCEQKCRELASGVTELPTTGTTTNCNVTLTECIKACEYLEEENCEQRCREGLPHTTPSTTPNDKKDNNTLLCIPKCLHWHDFDVCLSLCGICSNPPCSRPPPRKTTGDCLSECDNVFHDPEYCEEVCTVPKAGPPTNDKEAERLCHNNCWPGDGLNDCAMECQVRILKYNHTEKCLEKCSEGDADCLERCADCCGAVPAPPSRNYNETVECFLTCENYPNWDCCIDSCGVYKPIIRPTSTPGTPTEYNYCMDICQKSYDPEHCEEKVCKAIEPSVPTTESPEDCIKKCEVSYNSKFCVKQCNGGQPGHTPTSKRNTTVVGECISACVIFDSPQECAKKCYSQDENHPELTYSNTGKILVACKNACHGLERCETGCDDTVYEIEMLEPLNDTTVIGKCIAKCAISDSSQKCTKDCFSGSGKDPQTTTTSEKAEILNVCNDACRGLKNCEIGCNAAIDQIDITPTTVPGDTATVPLDDCMVKCEGDWICKDQCIRVAVPNITESNVEVALCMLGCIRDNSSQECGNQCYISLGIDPKTIPLPEKTDILIYCVASCEDDQECATTCGPLIFGPTTTVIGECIATSSNFDPPQNSAKKCFDQFGMKPKTTTFADKAKILDACHDACQGSKRCEKRCDVAILGTTVQPANCTTTIGKCIAKCAIFDSPQKCAKKCSRESGKNPQSITIPEKAKILKACNAACQGLERCEIGCDAAMDGIGMTRAECIKRCDVHYDLEYCLRKCPKDMVTERPPTISPNTTVIGECIATCANFDPPQKCAKKCLGQNGMKLETTSFSDKAKIVDACNDACQGSKRCEERCGAAIPGIPTSTYGPPTRPTLIGKCIAHCVVFDSPQKCTKKCSSESGKNPQSITTSEKAEILNACNAACQGLKSCEVGCDAAMDGIGMTRAECIKRCDVHYTLEYCLRKCPKDMVTERPPTISPNTTVIGECIATCANFDPPQKCAKKCLGENGMKLETTSFSDKAKILDACNAACQGSKRCEERCDAAIPGITMSTYGPPTRATVIGKCIAKCAIFDSPQKCAKDCSSEAGKDPQSITVSEKAEILKACNAACQSLKRCETGCDAAMDGIGTTPTPEPVTNTTVIGECIADCAVFASPQKCSKDCFGYSGKDPQSTTTSEKAEILEACNSACQGLESCEQGCDAAIDEIGTTSTTTMEPPTSAPDTVVMRCIQACEGDLICKDECIRHTFPDFTGSEVMVALCIRDCARNDPSQRCADLCYLSEIMDPRNTPISEKYRIFHYIIMSCEYNVTCAMPCKKLVFGPGTLTIPPATIETVGKCVAFCQSRPEADKCSEYCYRLGGVDAGTLTPDQKGHIASACISACVGNQVCETGCNSTILAPQPTTTDEPITTKPNATEECIKECEQWLTAEQCLKGCTLHPTPQSPVPPLSEKDKEYIYCLTDCSGIADSLSQCRPICREEVYGSADAPTETIDNITTPSLIKCVADCRYLDQDNECITECLKFEPNSTPPPTTATTTNTELTTQTESTTIGTTEAIPEKKVGECIAACQFLPEAEKCSEGCYALDGVDPETIAPDQRDVIASACVSACEGNQVCETGCNSTILAPQPTTTDEPITTKPNATEECIKECEQWLTAEQCLKGCTLDPTTPSPLPYLSGEDKKYIYCLADCSELADSLSLCRPLCREEVYDSVNESTTIIDNITTPSLVKCVADCRYLDQDNECITECLETEQKSTPPPTTATTTEVTTQTESTTIGTTEAIPENKVGECIAACQFSTEAEICSEDCYALDGVDPETITPDQRDVIASACVSACEGNQVCETGCNSTILAPKPTTTDEPITTKPNSTEECIKGCEHWFNFDQCLESCGVVQTTPKSSIPCLSGEEKEYIYCLANCSEITDIDCRPKCREDVYGSVDAPTTTIDNITTPSFIKCLAICKWVDEDHDCITECLELELDYTPTPTTVTTAIPKPNATEECIKECEQWLTAEQCLKGCTLDPTTPSPLPYLSGEDKKYIYCLADCSELADSLSLCRPLCREEVYDSVNKSTTTIDNITTPSLVKCVADCRYLNQDNECITECLETEQKSTPPPTTATTTEVTTQTESTTTIGTTETTIENKVGECIAACQFSTEAEICSEDCYALDGVDPETITPDQRDVIESACVSACEGNQVCETGCNSTILAPKPTTTDEPITTKPNSTEECIKGCEHWFNFDQCLESCGVVQTTPKSSIPCLSGEEKEYIYCLANCSEITDIDCRPKCREDVYGSVDAPTTTIDNITPPIFITCVAICKWVDEDRDCITECLEMKLGSTESPTTVTTAIPETTTAVGMCVANCTRLDDGEECAEHCLSAANYTIPQRRGILDTCITACRREGCEAACRKYITLDGPTTTEPPPSTTTIGSCVAECSLSDNCKECANNCLNSGGEIPANFTVIEREEILDACVEACDGEKCEATCRKYIIIDGPITTEPPQSTTTIGSCVAECSLSDNCKECANNCLNSGGEIPANFTVIEREEILDACIEACDGEKCEATCRKYITLDGPTTTEPPPSTTTIGSCVAECSLSDNCKECANNCLNSGGEIPANFTVIEREEILDACIEACDGEKCEATCRKYIIIDGPITTEPPQSTTTIGSCVAKCSLSDNCKECANNCLNSGGEIPANFTVIEREEILDACVEACDGEKCEATCRKYIIIDGPITTEPPQSTTTIGSCVAKCSLSDNCKECANNCLNSGGEIPANFTVIEREEILVACIEACDGEKCEATCRRYIPIADATTPEPTQSTAELGSCVAGCDLSGDRKACADRCLNFGGENSPNFTVTEREQILDACIVSCRTYEDQMGCELTCHTYILPTSDPNTAELGSCVAACDLSGDRKGCSGRCLSSGGENSPNFTVTERKQILDACIDSCRTYDDQMGCELTCHTYIMPTPDQQLKPNVTTTGFCVAGCDLSDDREACADRCLSSGGENSSNLTVPERKEILGACIDACQTHEDQVGCKISCQTLIMPADTTTPEPTTSDSVLSECMRACAPFESPAKCEKYCRGSVKTTPTPVTEAATLSPEKECVSECAESYPEKSCAQSCAMKFSTTTTPAPQTTHQTTDGDGELARCLDKCEFRVDRDHCVLVCELTIDRPTPPTKSDGELARCLYNCQFRYDEDDCAMICDPSPTPDTNKSVDEKLARCLQRCEFLDDVEKCAERCEQTPEYPTEIPVTTEIPEMEQISTTQEPVTTTANEYPPNLNNCVRNCQYTDRMCAHQCYKIYRPHATDQEVTGGNVHSSSLNFEERPQQCYSLNSNTP